MKDASGLSFGGKKQTQPPRLAQDVLRLVEKGIDVYVVEEDLAEQGLDREHIVDGLPRVARSRVPNLLGEFDRVWRW